MNGKQNVDLVKTDKHVSKNHNSCAACADHYPPPGLTRKQKVAWELGYRSLSFSFIKKTSGLDENN